jgi:tetratricopeptide (TPR) repeat protein
MGPIRDWFVELFTSGAVVILALYFSAPVFHLLQGWQMRSRLHQRMAAGKLNPHGFEARLALGEIYVKTRRWKRAIAELTAALEIDGGHAYGQSLLGYAHFRTREYGEAARHMERALEIRPEEGYGRTHLLIARSYDALGQKAKAIEWYRSAIRRNSSLCEPGYRLALALKETGDPKGFLTELHNTIEIFSRYDRGNYWRNLWFVLLAKARLLAEAPPAG